MRRQDEALYEGFSTFGRRSTVLLLSTRENAFHECLECTILVHKRNSKAMYISFSPNSNQCNYVETKNMRAPLEEVYYLGNSEDAVHNGLSDLSGVRAQMTVQTG